MANFRERRIGPSPFDSLRVGRKNQMFSLRSVVQHSAATARSSVTVEVAPSIVSQTPSDNQYVTHGGTVSFSVVADGTNLSYLWKKDGTSIGITTASFDLTNFDADTNSGAYTCEVSNTLGTVSTTSVTLAAATRILSQDPTQGTYYYITDPQLSVTAEGVDLQYQWYIGDSPAPHSSTSSTYSVDITAQSGNFHCNVTGADNVTAQSDVVSVNAGVAASIVAISPANGAYNTSQVLGVTAAGTPEPTYSWQYSIDNTSYAEVGTSYQYDVGSVNGYYKCIVTNPFGSVETGLWVIAVGEVAPSITSQTPIETQYVTNGGTVSFGVTADGTNLQYLWKKDGTSIGITTASFDLTGFDVATNGGSYTCDVYNILGSVASTAVTLAAATRLISQDPVQGTYYSPYSVNPQISVTAEGSNIQYQWYYNSNIAPGESTGSTYTIDISSNSGDYYCSITGADSVTVQSNTITYNSGYLPEITNVSPQPGVYETSQVLGVTAAGTPEPTYSWQYSVDDTTYAEVGTSSGYDVNYQNGFYKCVVTNPLGSASTSTWQIAIPG